MRKDVHTYSTAELRRWGLDTGFRTPEVRAIMLQGYVGDQLGRVADALEAMAPAARNGAGDVVGRTLSVAAALRLDGGGAPEPAAVDVARRELDAALQTLSTAAASGRSLATTLSLIEGRAQRARAVLG